jgi:hypothetical protein
MALALALVLAGGFGYDEFLRQYRYSHHALQESNISLKT